MSNTAPPPHAVSNLIGRHDATLQLMLQTLADERIALESGDIDALERITEIKSRTTEQLQLLGRELPPKTVCVQADAAGWSAVIELAARCEAANRRNASLLDVRTRATRGRLDALHSAAGRTAPAIYDRGGGAGGFTSRRFGAA